MGTAIKLNFSYNQILSIVKQLPVREKIKLSKELEKEGIESKLSDILKVFKTDELQEIDIQEEIESVRKAIYENKAD